MITTHLFIDWDSASRVSRIRINKDMPFAIRQSSIKQAYLELQEKVIDKLLDLEQRSPLKIIKTRIYHGWHRGTTPTDDRRAWEAIRTELRPISRSQISFLPDIDFGNELLCRGIRSTLYDTLRNDRQNPEVTNQKMVDTALVSDLLSHCRTESGSFRRNEKPNSLAVIVGDDDDLLPGAIVAEAWGLPTYVFRVTRANDCQHLKTNGIIHRI